MLAFVHARHDIETIIAYVGAVRAGLAVHLLNPDRPADNARLIDLYQPEFVIEPGAPVERRNGGNAARVHPDLAVLLSTSGSTGTPKLVKLSRENIESNTRSICEYLRIAPTDRSVTNLGAHYSYGLSVINTHLASGASLLVTDTPFEEARFWQDMRDYQVTNFSGVPHHFERLTKLGLDLGKYPHLRFLTQAGGRLSPDLVRDFAEQAERADCEFFVMYGQTEAAPRMSYLPPHLARVRPSSIGIAVKGGRMWLADAQGEAIGGEGEEGELLYAGPNVMCGYAHTRSDLQEMTALEVLHTGDLAVFDTDGLFYLTGRNSRIVKPFGLRLSLDEIEGWLREEGSDCAVIGNDEEIVIIIAQGAVDVAGLRQMLTERTGLPLTSFRIETARELPLLANGKLDYRQLTESHLEPATEPGLFRSFWEEFWGILTGKGTRPESAFAAYQTIFGGRVESDQSSFRSIGGDSLSMIQLQLLLEELVTDLPENWTDLPIAQIEKLAAGSRL